MAITSTQATIVIRSEAFMDGRPIPQHFTGEGADVSPPLSWDSLPEGVRELALICDDPDAPQAEPWVHWVIYKLPAGTRSLPEGLPGDAVLTAPVSALQGRNSWGRNNLGYRGPMPPKGHGVHHYFFKLYALNTVLDVKPGLDAAALRMAMKGHLLAEGVLMGTYQR